VKATKQRSHKKLLHHITIIIEHKTVFFNKINNVFGTWAFSTAAGIQHPIAYFCLALRFNNRQYWRGAQLVRKWSTMYYTSETSNRCCSWKASEIPLISR